MVRLLWLTIAAVLAAEVMVFVPAVTRARREWLSQHVRDGQIAIVAAAAAPDGLVNAMPMPRVVALVRRGVV